MFTVSMYCTRMMARSIRIGLVVDCTALDLEEFEPLPVTKPNAAKSAAVTRRKGGNSNNNNAAAKDPRVRYFHNPSEWDDYDVEYHRMIPPPVHNYSNNNDSISTGDDEPCAPKVLNEFFQLISKFQKSVSSSIDTTITHIALFDSRGGLGAAAYLAAAYMCHTLKAPVHAAIEALKEGTPPQPSPDNDPNVKWGLCDVRLVKDLQSRFMGKKEIVMEGKVPSWWWALDEKDEDDDDDEDGDRESTSNNEKEKRKREESIIIPPHESTANTAADEKKRPRHDNGSDGNSSNSLHPSLPKEALEPVPNDSPKYTRAVTVLNQLTQATPQSAESTPNVLPLKPELDISNVSSADNTAIKSIISNPNGYKVTWLSKGRRGLLLILSEAVFFVEQQSSSIQVSQVISMKFPTPQDSKKSQHRTLLDVVLVKDIERGYPTHRFYALDVLCIEGGRVWHKPWEHRWKFLNEGVVLPRKKEEAKQQQQPQQQHGHNYAKAPIKLRAKEYFPMKKLAFVMKDVCAGVAHEANGIRVVPMGEYFGDKKDTVMAVVWKRGGDVGDDKLVSLLS